MTQKHKERLEVTLFCTLLWTYMTQRQMAVEISVVFVKEVAQTMSGGFGKQVMSAKNSSFRTSVACFAVNY